MNRRFMWSLLVGSVSSFSLHIASAATMAFFPYSDEPMTPKLIFIYLLLPGWIVSGGPSYPVQLWRPPPQFQLRQHFVVSVDQMVISVVAVSLTNNMSGVLGK